MPGHKARWFNKNRERENAYRERHTMSLAAGARNGHIYEETAKGCLRWPFVCTLEPAKAGTRAATRSRRW